MSVEIACPHCSTRIKAPESALGRTVRCPKCKNQFVATAIGSQPVVTLSETDLAALPDSRSASPFDFDAVATTPTVAAAAATAATRGFDGQPAGAATARSSSRSRACSATTSGARTHAGRCCQ
jgi:predicted Zn finger-like uncharacterized protein